MISKRTLHISCRNAVISSKSLLSLNTGDTYDHLGLRKEEAVGSSIVWLLPLRSVEFIEGPILLVLDPVIHADVGEHSLWTSYHIALSITVSPTLCSYLSPSPPL